MKTNLLTPKELFYYSVRTVCMVIAFPFQKVGNWATDRLNKSYYKLTKENK